MTDNNIKHCDWAFDNDINPNDIAYEGPCFVYEQKDDYFCVNGFISDVINNPTYGDLFVIAEQQILATEDFHHVFLEDFKFVKKINNNISELYLSLGS